MVRMMKMTCHSESQLERKFCKKIQELGGMALKFTSPSQAGVPDRIILMPEGKIYFVEMKCETGRVRAIQKYIFEKFEKLGFKVHIINSDDAIKSFMEKIISVKKNE